MGALKVAGSNDTSGTDVVLCFRPGTSGYNPAWYTLANTGIAWDPVAGNDNASGAPGNAVQTWDEITRRFGNDSPTLDPGKNAIINKLSAGANVDTYKSLSDPNGTGARICLLAA